MAGEMTAVDNNAAGLAELMKPVLAIIADAGIDDGLERDLNEKLPPQSAAFKAIEAACHDGITAGWMCAEGAEGRRFGRVIEATPQSADLSVDVVDLTDIVGPHHRHPTGEICMIMPVSDGALFDGRGVGWCVNPPESGHRPTVSGGRALVLYLLPHGEIDFTE